MLGEGGLPKISFDWIRHSKSESDLYRKALKIAFKLFLEQNIIFTFVECLLWIHKFKTLVLILALKLFVKKNVNFGINSLILKKRVHWTQNWEINIWWNLWRITFWNLSCLFPPLLRSRKLFFLLWTISQHIFCKDRTCVISIRNCVFS